MDIPQKDRAIIREVKKRLIDLAQNDPTHDEKLDLWRRLNNLERVRPLILLQDSTDLETGHLLNLQCESEMGRIVEGWQRTALSHLEHMPTDSLHGDNTMTTGIALDVTPMGLQQDTTDPDHVFGARHFNCAIPDGADPGVIPMPTVTIDHEGTEQMYQEACDLHGDLVKVKKGGGVAGHWFSVTDQFFTYRSLDKAFLDMVDNPRWMHSWLERMTQYFESIVDQYEALNVLVLNNGACGVGPGGYGTTDRLPQPDFDGVHVRAKDQWAHSATQIFSEVSPAMHEEFALQYEARLLNRFGLAGYGCCEPLDRKIDILKKHLPHLHRVSISPWADVERAAEAIGKTAVFSYKPNPAILGGEVWDVDYAREQLRDVFEKTRGCCVEVIMKDLHTVRGDPSRMWEWVSMAKDLAEQYA